MLAMAISCRSILAVSVRSVKYLALLLYTICIACIQRNVQNATFRVEEQCRLFIQNVLTLWSDSFVWAPGIRNSFSTRLYHC